MTALRRLLPIVCGLLLVSLLVARAFVPSGWMPVATERGIEVLLCTGEGPRTLELAADGSFHERQQDAPRDPCPFAIGGWAPFILAVLQELPLPPAALSALQVPGLVSARLVAWRALRPPARGPPSFA